MTQVLRGNILYRLAGPEDDEELRKLLRDQAMEGWVQLSLEREPSFFLGQTLMGESQVVMAQEEAPAHRTVGMYTCSRLPVHLNGCPTRLPYLGGLRIEPTFRHRLGLLKDGFDSLPVLTDQPTPFAFTSLASGNRSARRLLEANLNGMPTYQPIGELVTLALPAQRRPLKAILIPAALKDVPSLAAFFNQHSRQSQFGAHLDETWLAGLNGAHGLHLEDFWLLREGQDLHGCIAVWDQRVFKQIVVRGYRSWLSWLRTPYNGIAPQLGFPRLPAPGQALSNIFLAFAAFRDPGGETALSAVRESLSKVWEKGGELGLLGLSSSHPLLHRLNRSHGTWSYRTWIESVHWRGNPIPSFDPLPVQPEIALL